MRHVSVLQRLYLVVCVVAVLAAVVVGLVDPATPGGTRTTEAPSFQGGWFWCCGAGQLGATWNVPMVQGDDTSGNAGTWIGAQDGGTGGGLIQVGTIVTADQGVTQYEAFWADGAVGYSAQYVGVVQPLDEVTATMSQTRGDWTLRFVDHTQGWTKTLHVRYERGRLLQFADWIEEDPKSGASTNAPELPYAKLSTIRMRGLVVNGAAPDGSQLTREQLKTKSGTIITPTPIVHDGFEIPGGRS